jgi:gamma-glutamylcyclotransferase (GGCT)/AIG2-like uncharacterized protein YtfP
MQTTHNLNQIIVYGSLRKGGRNWRTLIPDSILVETTYIAGYQMFRINKGHERLSEPYPFIVETGMKSHKIKVELVLLTNDELRAVQRAESAYLTKSILIQGYEKPFLLYVQDEKHKRRYKPEHVEKVLGNNWVPFARKRGIF